VERSKVVAAQHGGLGSPGELASLVGVDEAEGVETGVQRPDAGEDGVDGLDGRDVPGTNLRGELDGRQEAEVVRRRGHGASSLVQAVD
jgi:hypothetical protein